MRRFGRYHNEDGAVLELRFVAEFVGLELRDAWVKRFLAFWDVQMVVVSVACHDVAGDVLSHTSVSA